MGFPPLKSTNERAYQTAYTGVIITVLAVVGIVLGDANETTVITDSDDVGIGGEEESFSNKLGGTVGDEDITFHLGIKVNMERDECVDKDRTSPIRRPPSRERPSMG